MILNEATQKFIREHLHADVRQLALLAHRYQTQEIDFPFALSQIAGRQQIEHKIPSWRDRDDLLFPARLPLEQCSSEATAQYKALLVSGDSLADLTGGFGVDTAFLAPRFSQVFYVEKQTELAAIAQHNFSSLGLNHIQIHTGDGLTFLKTMPPVDYIYLDPARRSSSGKKVWLIEDCEPDLLQIQMQLLDKARFVLIKFSPMLDIQAVCRTLKNISAMHVVSVENECKELLFLLENQPVKELKLTCVNLRKQGNQTDTFLFPEEKEAQIVYSSEVKKYLYEPNTSILKAGMYKSLALRYNIDKLHSDSHLYTSEQLISGFPGRIFEVENIISFRKNDLKTHLHGLAQANLAIRNFPSTVAELRKKLHLSEGGDVYLFATTLAGGQRVLVRGRKMLV
ncbi:MAG: SAM-dependent methyltransferase [Dysgonamonadaceae bacterium]|jgi:16S rRNA G966 N2-methylase RsmD|nr:SAM-dependent methyltransferase [Dysgonamonadaceae bacterium]